MPPFETFYNSALHHPGASFAATLLVLVAIALRRPPLAPLLVLLQCEIAIDAYFTGALSPLSPNAPAATTLAIVFVVLGDWRYFYLVERQLRKGRGAAALASLGWAMLLPASSGALTRLFPATFLDSRHVFLAYELGLALLTFIVGVRIRRALPDAKDPVRRFLLALTFFELVQYSLWATADVVILAGWDFGFALRILPNVLYYAFFVPFVFATAPREARA